MEDAKEILTLINNNGYEAYIVGGAVRDHLLNRDCDDIDIATNMPIKIIEKLFQTHDIGKNKDFGVSIIKYNNKIYEIANFRSDGIYSDGRRPDSIEIVNSFEEDCLRRDFTINGMGIGVDGNIIDYVGGLIDLNKRIIKCIGNPKQRFKEDYLRMLRAIRFASIFSDFTLHLLTRNAIIKYAHNINFVSKERIQKELWKMASQSGEKFAKAIHLLKETNLLQYILPEIDCMDKYEHNPKYHPEGSCFQHTLAALKEYKGDDPVVNLSILFHDVGKPVTRHYEEDGNVTYHRHAYYGVKVAENICNRLKFSNEVKETILFCVENHMKFHKFFDMKDSKIIKLINNKNWDTLLEVGFVDDICRGFDTYRFWINAHKKVKKLFAKYVENQEYNKIKKLVNGKLIMKLTGLSEGPKVGKIQKETIEWIFDNDISLNNDEVIEEHIIKMNWIIGE